MLLSKTEICTGTGVSGGYTLGIHADFFMVAQQPSSKSFRILVNILRPDSGKRWKSGELTSQFFLNERGPDAGITHTTVCRHKATAMIQDQGLVSAD